MQHSGNTTSCTCARTACCTNASILLKLAGLSAGLLSICTAATRMVRWSAGTIGLRSAEFGVRIDADSDGGRVAPSGRLEFAQTEIAPHDVERLFAVTDPMDLKTDKSSLRYIIGQV